MPIRKKTLYTYIILSCLLGYIWVYINYTQVYILKGISNICLFKHITGIPCPSCGSTRSVLSVLDGNFLNSLFVNPIGALLVIILIVAPLWLITDLVYKRSTFYNFYLKLENTLRIKWVTLVSIFLVSANWIWTICKHI